MSETNTPIVGVEGQPASTEASDDAEYEGIIKQLDSEGLTPSSDQDDPDQRTEDDEIDDLEPRVKLKVNGKIIEKTQDEVVKMAQLYSATEMKLETAKKEIEEARSTKRELQTQQNAVRDLLGVMQRGEIDKISEFVHEKLGAGDLWDKAIVQAALKLYEISKMSPEQRESLENKKLVTKLRAEAEERTKSEKQRAYDYEVNQWSEHINVEVPKAIKMVGLPDTAWVRSHIISTWRAAIERGQSPTAAAVANYVKKQLEESKMLGNNKVELKQVVTRPRATPSSVGHRNGKAEDTGYIGWDTWLKTRGK